MIPLSRVPAHATAAAQYSCCPAGSARLSSCRCCTWRCRKAPRCTCLRYAVTLIGKYLTYALLALAVDLVWGYCGILSLGHAAFFALGGYAMGMYLMRQIGTRGVYGDPVLPDFMVFLNWKELPWFWHGFDMFWFAMLMVVLVPGLLALVFGWFAFRSRVTGVYLSIITQALTYALMLAFFRNDMGFGGNNGFTDFKDLLGLRPAHAGTCSRAVRVQRRGAGAGIPRLPLHRRRRAPAAWWQAVRDAESRTRFIGYRVESYKLWIFVFSAVLAGIAGALYVPQVGIINPERVLAHQLHRGGDLGGHRWPRHAVWRRRRGHAGELREDLFHHGAARASGCTSLGALFVLITLFLPRGVVGLLGATAQGRRARRARRGATRRLAGMNAAQCVKQRWQQVFGAGTGTDRSTPGPTPRTA